MPYLIYADIEALIKKIDGCENNPEKSSTTKIGEHIPCRYSMSTIWGFDHIEDEHTLYRGKDCMKNVCESLKEHPKCIIDFEKKKMLPLTREELESHEDAKVCYICGIILFEKLFRDKNYRKVRDHSQYRGKNRDAEHSICNLKFNGPNEIPVVLLRGSNYGYHFIIKELSNEFEGQFECFGENKEKYKTFFVPIQKEIIKIYKNGIKTDETISYKIKFIDSARFMASSLSNLVDNLMEGTHKVKCEVCGCFLEYKCVKGNLIIYKCLSCNKCYLKKLNEWLKEKFKNTFKFYNKDINKFVLLLRKGVYAYEYICDWEKFNETTLPKKKEFYSNLNLEDITDADYMHAKRVCKDFETKNLGEYHELYLKRDVLFLADVFENFRKIYELDPVKFISAPGLAWQPAFKKTEVKLELLTDVDMLLMVGKGIRGGICHAIHRYAKTNNR